MPSRKITIDITTQANLKGLNSLISKLDTLQKSLGATAKASPVTKLAGEINKLTKSLDSLAASNRAVVQASNAQTRAATSQAQATAKSTQNLKHLTQQVMSTQQAIKSFGGGLTAIAKSFAAQQTPLQHFKTLLASVLQTIAKFGAAASQLATAIGTKLASGLRTATTALTTLGRSAGTVFSGMQRALNGVIKGVSAFSSAISTHMKSAEKAMKQFYNSGWSLLTTGYIAKGAGKGMLGGLTSGLGQFMDYEKLLTRASIAGRQTPQDLEKIIFGLQRGTIGNAPIKGFGADEIAQAMYYYSSAIGTAVTEANAGVVSTILQMASVTQTSVETATKGLLNIATEFGIDPRDNRNAPLLENIAAQMGYLANLSTMEVPDIAETFKMVGPMAHILSPGGKGSGLNETMALAFFASEVGLRGSNVGRGINQMLTTLLDPTDKAVEAAAKTFGIGVSKEAFKNFFFDAEGNLRGGLPGLFKKLQDVPEADAASLLAELFTTNATRSVIGIREGLKKAGGIEGILKDISGKDPMDWLTESIAKTNQSIFASFQNLKNAWFSVQTAMIRSVQGPFTKAMNALADVIWRIGDVLRNPQNQWIGQLITGITAFVGIALSAVGILFMLGGSILLVAKAFSMLGGFITPSIFFLSTFAEALLIVVPLFAAIAAGVILVRHAWDTNFEGIQDRVHAFIATLQQWGDWVLVNGPAMGKAIEAVVTARVLEGFERLQEWLKQNEDRINKFRAAAEALGKTFLSGIFKGITDTLTGFVALSVRLAQALPGITRGIADFIKQLTGVTVTLDGFVKALGAAVGVWAVFTLIPGVRILAMLGLRFAILGTQVALYAAKLALATAAYAVQATAAAGVIALKIAYGAVVASLTALEWAEAAATSGVSAAFVVLEAVLAPLVIAGAALIGIGAAIVAGFSVLAVVMLANAAATDGLAGVLAGLIGLWQGFWAVMKPTVEILVAITIGIMKAADAFAQFIGIGDSFVLVGGMIAAGLTLMITGVTTLAIAMVASGVAAAIAWIAALSPVILLILAIVAAIGALAVALNQLGFLDDVFNGMAAGWDYVSDHIQSAIDKAQEYIRVMLGVDKNAVSVPKSAQMEAERIQYAREAVMNAADPNLDLKRKAQFQQETGSDPYLASGEYYQWNIDQWNKEHGGYVQANVPMLDKTGKDTGYTEMVTLDPVQVQKYKEGVQDQLLGAAEETSKDQSFMGQMADKLGISDMLAKWGVDPSNLNIKDIQKAFGFDALTEGLDNTQKTLVDQYLQQTSAWDNYAKMVKDKGKLVADAFYEANDIPIPEDPGLLTTWLTEQDEAVGEVTDDTVQKLKDFNQQVRDALAAGFDLPKSLAFGFDQGKGANFLGLPSAMGMIADSLVQNIPEGATWSNIYEGIMDTVGQGFDATANVYGKNVHTMLANSPGFQNWAAEMGMSVEDMLKDVPTFIADERYIPMAFTEIAEMISQYAQDGGNYTALDHLGADIGKGIAGAGLDWGELATYAVSQAQAGDFDWNLTDYLTEAWDMTKADVEAYLKDHGIDPSIVGGAMTPDLQLMLESAGGQINVFNDEWYAWYQKQLEDATPNIIEITQEAFDNMPESIKISMSGMGFVFHIEEPDIKIEDDPKIQKLIDDAYAGYLSQFTNPSDPHYVGREGGPTSVPLTFDQWNVLPSPGLGMGGGPAAPVAQDLPGLPPPPDYATGATERAQAFITQFSSDLTTLAPTVDIDMTIFDEKFKGMATSAATAFTTQFHTDMTRLLAGGNPAAGDGTGGEGGGAVSGGGPFDAMFKTYAFQAAEAFAGEGGLKSFIGPKIWGLSLTEGEGSAAGPFDDDFKAFATTAIMAFGEGIATLSEKMGAELTESVGVINLFLPVTFANGFNLGWNLQFGFTTGVGDLSATLGGILSATVGIIEGYSGTAYNSGFNLGFNIGAGIEAGINSKIGAVSTAAQNLVNASHASGQATAEVASPSKLFMRLGEQLGQGLAVGMTNTEDLNASAADRLINSAFGTSAVATSLRPWQYARPPENTGNGDLHINVHIAKMEKDVDLNNALNKLDILQGKRVEKARRGMIPTDTQRSV